MNVKKKIYTTEDLSVHFYGITLLSSKEYDEYKNIIPIINGWWWLRSSGSHRSFATEVYNDDSPCSRYVSNVSGCVRPALIGNFKSSNLRYSDKFILIGYNWTVLNDWLALCDDVVGKTYFRKDANASDANDFEHSDIKKWLYRWTETNGIKFNTEDDKDRIIQVLKDQIALCGDDPEKERYSVTFTKDDAKLILKSLQDCSSTLGTNITEKGITFTSTGDAEQGEKRGKTLGELYMRDCIVKELLYRNLFTNEIKDVIRTIPID